MESLADHLIWGTAATRHAASWPHIDNEGFATMSSIQVGSKYWLLGRPKQQSAHSMDRINAFGIGYQPEGEKAEESESSMWALYDYEGVLLTPGPVL